jgi:hypothetical protein
MRWLAKDPKEWSRRYALLPIKIAHVWIWLEWYEAKDMGEYILIRTIPKEQKQ